MTFLILFGVTTSSFAVGFDLGKHYQLKRTIADAQRTDDILRRELDDLNLKCVQSFRAAERKRQSEIEMEKERIKSRAAQVKEIIRVQAPTEHLKNGNPPRET